MRFIQPFRHHLILDKIPTSLAAAFSVNRKLRYGYAGPLIRVRETGSSGEADIGFNSIGRLDTAALAALCGANTGTVVKVYDQSGNGRDLVQNTASAQPQVYDGASEETLGGAIVALFDGSDDWMVTSGFTFNGDSTWFLTHGQTSWTSADVVTDGVNSFYLLDQRFTSPNLRLRESASGPEAVAALNTLELATYRQAGASSTLQIDDGSEASGDCGSGVNPGGISVGLYGNGTGTAGAIEFGELLVWNSVLSATDKALIQSDINDYYSLW